MLFRSSLFSTSTDTLRRLALAAWYVGSLVLFLKAAQLFLEAHALNPVSHWPISAGVAGIFIGIIKALFIFNNSCRTNLERINTLSQPLVWQFFRPRFFLFLFLMVLLGATLSRLAHGNFPMLIGVGCIDLSIGVALLTSSHVFWSDGGKVKE